MLCALALTAGCFYGSPGYRSLHYVDGELVSSRPASSAAYATYIKARLAYEEGHLEAASVYIQRALRFDPRDPHLWTTHAEIAAKAGDDDTALAAASRALQLRPNYPPARKLMASLRGGPSSAAVEAGAELDGS
jgi:predicted Zn-dependent protease